MMTCLGSVWEVFGKCLGLFGKCLGSVWEMFGKCLGLFGKCLGLFGKCLGSVSTFVANKCRISGHFVRGR